MIVYFILGSVIASFINLISYRLKNKESFVFGFSHCEYCYKRLKYYELIPIFSYLILGFKCIKCKNKINPRYFLCEILLATIFLIFKYHSINFQFYIIISLCFLSSLTDIDNYDVYSFVNILILIVSLSIGINIKHIFINFVLMFLLYLITQNKMGYGDIETYFVLGIIYDIYELTFLIFLSNILALLYIIIFKIKKDTYIALVPFISIAYLLMVFFKHSNYKILSLFL